MSEVDKKFDRLCMLAKSPAYGDFKEACANEVRRCVEGLLSCDVDDLIDTRAELKSWVKMANLLEMELQQIEFIKKSAEQNQQRMNSYGR